MAKSEMKNSTIAISFSLILIFLATCACSNEEKGTIAWFPKIDTTVLSSSPNIDFIPNLTAYQQTTDYTCGPAALLSLAKFYGWPDIAYDAKTEMRIAHELGTRDMNSSRPGSKPQEMVAWLEKNGFDAKLEFEEKDDGTALLRLRENIIENPYDMYDDYCDGYSFVNANRFYWMWFDALYFDNTTWRTMITAIPKERIGRASNL